CWSRRLKLQYPDLPIDDAEEVDFKELETRINAFWRKNVLRGPPTLALLYKFVNRTVRLELKNRLRKRGILPWQENCGSCKQLSALKMCAKREEQRKKTDPPCEHYSLKLPIVISLDGEIGSDDTGRKEKLMREIHERLKQIAQSNNPETSDDKKPSAETSSEPPLLLRFKKFAESLAQRCEQAKQGSKQKIIYERQYEEWVHIVHQLSHSDQKKTYKEIRAETVKIFAQKLKLTERHIRRDLEEIEALLWDFLKQ
ncbi:MAG: hypothetical protein GY797_34185, partial [Deltaproteobacteria bacterium]|nr:hypothetical protein [Deltaproteobacteria bacterium]